MARTKANMEKVCDRAGRLVAQRLELHGTVTKKIIVADHPRAQGQRKPKKVRKSSGASLQESTYILNMEKFFAR